MDKILDSILRFVRGISKIVWLSTIAIIGLIAVLIAFVTNLNKDNHIDVAIDKRIDITPTQIQSIQNIGQWEFLSINDEELVDTVSRGFFGDSELTRIYYGTLRLGIDLHKAGPKWITVEDTTITAILPPIELLDRNFIDEARTRPFFESGKWTQADREALYHRAYKMMLQRCMTRENIDAAENHARQQFKQLFRSMGFRDINIQFEQEQKKETK
jgi:hypothetical protein